MRKRYTVEEREQFARDVGAGMSVSEAAERLGMHASVGYRWKRAARSSGATEESSKPRFAKLVSDAGARSSAVVVEVGGAVVRVEAGFDAVLLRAVVSALSSRAE